MALEVAGSSPVREPTLSEWRDPVRIGQGRSVWLRVVRGPIVPVACHAAGIFFGTANGAFIYFLVLSARILPTHLGPMKWQCFRATRLLGLPELALHDDLPTLPGG